MRNKLFKISFTGQGKAKRLLSFGLSCLFLFFIVGSTQQLNAQEEEITVTGQVTDANTEEPLPGVTIVIQGTTIGTITDAEGEYSLEVRDPSDILEFSFMGYMTQEIEVGGQRVIDVALSPEITALDEIVVVGYGTQRRGDVTSAVSSVSSEDFIRGGVRDAAQLIQGQTAGLSVTTPGGDPGAGSEIMLRGITTLMSGTSPLVLIDGVPGDLQSVAPEDIESIDVLKDGSAAAIYGTRGTNGVILITTKSGERGIEPQIEYQTQLTTHTIKKRAGFLDAETHRQKIEEGFDLRDHGHSTDWLDEITRTPFSHEHNVSFRGGSEQTSYLGSINYREREGIFRKSDNQLFHGRVEIDHSMFDDRLNARLTLNNRYRDHDGFSTFTYRQAMIRNPTDAIIDEEGNWKEHPGKFQYENPVARLEETHRLDESKNLRMSGRLEYAPTDDLRFEALAHRTKTDGNYGYFETHDHITTVRDGRGGYASRSASASRRDLLEFTGHYGTTIDNHRMSFLAGYSWEDEEWENQGMSNYDFPTDAFSFDNIGEGDALSRGEANQWSSRAMRRLIGAFTRVNYTYDDRYMLMASVRREGSSKFGADHQWGTFPAASVGWAIAQEDFMQDYNMIDELKLRAGYGVTGTEPSDPYMSLTRLTYGARFLVDGQWVPSIEPASNPNPDLRWERKEEINIGLDFSFYDGRIDGALDVYERNTHDLLYNYSVPVPPNLYGSMTANVGQMQNRGLEATLRGVPIQTEDLYWQTGLNYSTNENELVSLTDETYDLDRDYFYSGYTGDPIQTHTHRIDIGGPMGNFHGYKVVGVDEDGKWLLEDEDGEIIPAARRTPDDKKILGNGLPDHYLSWNNTFYYDDWDLNISMRGAFGFQILNFQRMFYENVGATVYDNVLESAFEPVFGEEHLDFEQEYVSYYIEDGDYWKIDNITIGYTFDGEAIPYVREARVFFSGLNLFTFTGYEGIDPEVSRSGWAPGNDNRDQYPTQRTFTLGFNLHF